MEKLVSGVEILGHSQRCSSPTDEVYSRIKGSSVSTKSIVVGEDKCLNLFDSWVSSS